jgi:hypothetical protein
VEKRTSKNVMELIVSKIVGFLIGFYFNFALISLEYKVRHQRVDKKMVNFALIFIVATYFIPSRFSSCLNMASWLFVVWLACTLLHKTFSILMIWFTDLVPITKDAFIENIPLRKDATIDILRRGMPFVIMVIFLYLTNNGIVVSSMKIINGWFE